MAYLGQFYLAEQFLGAHTLPEPLCPISRHRIPLGFTVRKSLSGNSFPKTGKYKKEITYRHRPNSQERYRYRVTCIPSGPPWASIWQYWRTAVSLWQALSPSEKYNLDRRASSIGPMSGFNLYIREYIRANY